MNIKKVIWYLRTQLFKFQYGKVGKYSYIGKVAFIQRKRNVYIGNNVRIYPGMRAELSKPSAKIVIDDNVSIGQNFHIVTYDEVLVISKNVTISGNVFISNVDHDYKKIGLHILNQNMIKKHTYIGENCFLGYGCVILPGTILGKQCVVGSNSVVSGTFPDYSVIVGVPAKIVKHYDCNNNVWKTMEKNYEKMEES